MIVPKFIDARSATMRL